MLDADALLWGGDAHLTLSFAPDGTEIAGLSSSLFSTFNAVAPTDQWQEAILQPFRPGPHRPTEASASWLTAAPSSAAQAPRAAMRGSAISALAQLLSLRERSPSPFLPATYFQGLGWETSSSTAMRR